MSFDAAAEFDRQREALVRAGYPQLTELPEPAFSALLEPLRPAVLAAATDAAAPTPGRLTFLLVVPAAPARTVPRTALNGKPGQVSRHLPDLDRFVPTVPLPAAGAYALLDVQRGEEFCGRIPNEAFAELAGRARTPLTIEEGVALITLSPGSLAKNKCFSLGGSRCGDRRVPALWISAGAPMLGWCWAGNPHSWLGVASCRDRIVLA